MLKNQSLFSLSLGVLLIVCLSTQNLFGQTNDVKTKITKYGVGKKVSILLKDGKKIKGKIQSIDSDTFVMLTKAGLERSVDYDSVSSVKKSGISNGVWIAIGAAAAGAIIFAATLGRRCRNESGNSLCL